MKKKTDNNEKKSKHKILITLSLIAVTIFYVALMVFLYRMEIISKKLTGFLIIAPFIIIILVLAIVTAIKRAVYFDKGFYSETMIYPAEAVELVKKYFHDERGILVDVEPRINIASKSGKQPTMSGYLYHKFTDRLETFTVPLNRGKDALLQGIINLWDDRPLRFDQKIEDQFGGEGSTPPDVQTFARLTPKEKMTALSAVGKDTPEVLYIEPQFNVESMGKPAKKEKTEKNEVDYGEA